MKSVRAICELLGIAALFIGLLLYPPMHAVWTVVGGIVLFYAILWLFFKWWAKARKLWLD
jgi:hypothetical protein